MGIVALLHVSTFTYTIFDLWLHSIQFLLSENSITRTVNRSMIDNYTRPLLVDVWNEAIKLCDRVFAKTKHSVQI